MFLIVSYKLIPLVEFNKSFKVNKHLPNIPSDAEIEKNSIAQASKNKRLIQKVEELTLYVIQLKKENNCTEERLRKLENIKK